MGPVEKREERVTVFMVFDDFGLIEPLLRAVREEGYTLPTAIQEQAIPHILRGSDVLGCAQTGTGKTAAFALPILQRLYVHRQDGPRIIRSLIVSPTRELAAQIGESFSAYGRHTGLRQTTIFGGVRSGPQRKILRAGVDILVATPGRLLDLVGQGVVDLGRVQVLVLDEADRMLDMGFIDDIRRIVALVPRQRQTLFFSATMPHEIQHLADSILHNAIELRITPEAPEPDTVDQTVYFVERQHKHLLLAHLLTNEAIRRGLVFTRTKRAADRLTRTLRESNIEVDVIHSDRSQNERERALDRFKKGHVRVLVASDIASRGLDVEDISHVFNYDLPEEPETYVHRIGRTGRAGATGTAVSFCGIEERCYLDQIEKLIHHPLAATNEHPFPSPMPRAAQRASLAAAAKPPPVMSNGWRKPLKRNLLGGRRRR